VIYPEQQPDKYGNGNDEYEDQRADEHGEEGPVLPGVVAGLANVSLHEPVVAAVGLPGNVKGIPEHGNGADEYTDGEIDSHACEGDIGNAAGPCGDGDNEGENAGDCVAETGNQADDSIDAKTEAGKRYAEGFVEENLNAAQCLIAEEPCAFVPSISRHDCALDGARPRGAEACRIGVGIGHKRLGCAEFELIWFDATIRGVRRL